MRKVECNIYYGTKDIEEIFEELINEKIIQVTLDIKRGEITGDNNVKENPSTVCVKKGGVVRK